MVRLYLGIPKWQRRVSICGSVVGHGLSVIIGRRVIVKLRVGIELVLLKLVLWVLLKLLELLKFEKGIELFGIDVGECGLVWRWLL